MIEEKENALMWIKKYCTTEYITIITLIIYGWGILFNYFYYNGFGINITKYLSLQEILIDTSIYTLVLLIISFIFLPISYYLALLIYLLKGKNNKRIRFVSVKKTINNRYYLSFLNHWFSVNYILLFFLALLLSSGYFIIDIELYLYCKYAVPIIGISTIIQMYVLTKYGSNYLKYFFYFAFSTMSIIAISAISDMKSKSILSSKHHNREIISLSNGKNYTTNDSIFTIGETSSTIFLYNKFQNNTIIINRENVLQIELIKQATAKPRRSATN